MLNIKYFLIFIFTTGLILHSCKGDDDFVTEDAYENSLGTCDEDLGDFNMLPESLNITPYQDKSKIIFENATGEKKEFNILEKNPLNIDGLFLDYNVFMDGDTVGYCFTTQRKQFIISNLELDIQFEINIETRPYYASLEDKLMADVINIFYTDKTVSPERYVLIFRKNIDKRNYPVDLYTNNTVLENKEFLSQSFNAVEFTNYNSPNLHLYFNQTEGIVAFENAHFGLWRFSTLE